MSSTIEQLIAAEGLPPDYRNAVETYWRPLSEEIAMRALDRPLVVGISGGQGSGKSTLCRFLEALLVEHNQRAATLALDDLYLPRADRARLAREVHPLLETRGVPGTHDTALGLSAIEDFRAGRDLELPRFDKAADDRIGRLERVPGPLRVLLLEGWCIGAAPQDDSALAEPINALEASGDADGRWRAYVNEALRADYADLFAEIDMLVMLRVADFASVRRNRALQEDKLRARRPDAPRVMGPAELDRFLAHYERLTLHALADVPSRADYVVDIGPDLMPLGTRPALL